MKLDFNKKVLVIGDIILDKYIFGNVKRMSPEAPVPVLKIENNDYRLGGAANVAANIASLGGQATLIGTIGDDKEGEIVKELLEKKNIKFIPIKIKHTIVKTRFIANRQQLLRADLEKIESKQFILPNTDEFDSIVLSDYAKGTVTKELFEQLNHKNVIINLKPKNKDICKNVSLIVVNESESNEITNNEDPNEAIKIMYEKFKSNILITRGSKGMIIFENGRKIDVPTESKEVYDVTGAGDTVIATLALSLEKSLEEAAILANHSAGIVIQKIGTSTVSFKELKEILEKENTKIKTREELQEIITDLKHKGKKIVHTNGSFDILHAGHLETLKKSKKLGDILVVSINSDESIRKFKGEGRPILNQNERAALLAALEHIDYVTIFPEDDILKTLEMLKPHIHTKGGTFLEDRLQKEKDLLKTWNGEFKQFEMIEDKSTTKIIKRVLDKTSNGGL